MVKAVVLGASGGIGQPLSLLCKLSPLIDDLALYDVVNTPGVAADLSHISSAARLTGHLPKEDGLEKALTGADICIIPAGIPRKPGMTRDDLFKINAGIVQGIIKGVAQFCPKAYILVISNPVNSTVPIAAETLKAAGVFDAKKLFGVTTLDIVRAETFLKEANKLPSNAKVSIPVIGGHSGETIVPLFSQGEPKADISEDALKALIHRVQFGGDEVVKAKDGAGSATLSMAYAGFRFAEQVLKAHGGEKDIVTPSFIHLAGVPGGEAIEKATGCEYFSVPVKLGPSGVEQAINPLDNITAAEKKLIEIAVEGAEGAGGLKRNIKAGIDFVKNPPPPPAKKSDAPPDIPKGEAPPKK